MGCVGRLQIFAVGMSVLAGCGGETVGQVLVHDTPPKPSTDAGTASGEGVNGRSGTRLTVNPYSPHVTDSSSPHVTDSSKGVECEPRVGADGSRRCLPPRARGIFSDANCTHPVISLAPDPCGVVTQYLSEAGGPAGCLVPKTTMYTPGAQIETPPELYYHNAGFCSLMGGPNLPLPSGPFYEAVASDATDWVELTEEVVPVTETLGVSVWNGADGSRIPNGLRLLATGTACEMYPRPYDSHDPQTHCVPTLRAQQSGEYPNDQCTGDTLFASCGPTDVVELRSGTDASGLFIGPNGVFETGATISPVYYVNPFDGDKCAVMPPLSGPDASFFYSIGPSLDLNRYPILTHTSAGSGRIQTQYLTSERKHLFAEFHYDTKYGQPCFATKLSDGATWCVPGAVEFDTREGGYYVDSDCSRPAAITDGPPGAPEVLFGLVYGSSLACSPTLPPTLYSIVERSGPMFQWSTWTGERRCAEVSGTEPGTRIFEAGTPLDPSEVLAPVSELP